MKQIVYRGGIARFRLPCSWIEEYNSEGGGVFYEDKPNSGTLRINVMDLKPPGGSNLETAFDFISQVTDSKPVKILAGGGAIVRSSETLIENDQKISLHTWHIGLRITPSHYRLIVFTYTILANEELGSTTHQEVAMLDELIFTGEYSPSEGVTGNFFIGEK